MNKAKQYIEYIIEDMVNDTHITPNRVQCIQAPYLDKDSPFDFAHSVRVFKKLRMEDRNYWLFPVCADYMYENYGVNDEETFKQIWEEYQRIIINKVDELLLDGSLKRKYTIKFIPFEKAK